MKTEKDKNVDCTNISIGQVFDNYKELSLTLGEKVKKGNSKILQMKNWERYFSYDRIDGSNKYIITDIFKEPKPIIKKDMRDDTVYFDLFEKSLLLYIYSKYYNGKNDFISISMSKTELCGIVGLSNDDFGKNYGKITQCIKALNGDDKLTDDLPAMLNDRLFDHLTNISNMSLNEWYHSAIRQVRAKPDDINKDMDSNRDMNSDNGNYSRSYLSYILSPEEQLIQDARIIYTKIFKRVLDQMSRVTINGRHYVNDVDLDGVELRYQDSNDMSTEILTCKASPSIISTLDEMQNKIIKTVFKKENSFAFFRSADESDISILKRKMREQSPLYFDDLIYCDHFHRIYMTFDLNAVRDRLLFLGVGIDNYNEIKKELNELVVSAIRSRIISDAYNYMVMAYGYWDKVKGSNVSASKTFLYNYNRVKRSVVDLNGADKPSEQVAIYLKRMYLMMIKVCYNNNVDEYIDMDDSYFLALVDMYKNDKGAKRDNWDNV